MRPLILITQGDHNGIGPEIALRAATSPALHRLCTIVLVGSTVVFEYYCKILRKRIVFEELGGMTNTVSSSALSRALAARTNPKAIPVIQCGQNEAITIRPGRLSADAGKLAGECLVTSARLCTQGYAQAMVTAPVSKQALNLGGYAYTGQTDMLAAFCRTQRYAMMLVADHLRVGLVTTHLPLKSVHKSIRRRRVLEKIKIIHDAVKGDFAIRSPRIAVLGLNPHAGENGLLGKEENEEISPAVQSARSKNIGADGPFPADGFFGTHAYRSYNAVLAMYHDQGLIPLKMTGFGRGVNFSAGLPIVRTSPDHGTAFDIAGKGIANPSSMVEAVKLAALIVRNRMRRSKT